MAEAVEGRPVTKENILEPNICQTQSWERMNQRFPGVREGACVKTLTRRHIQGRNRMR